MEREEDTCCMGFRRPSILLRNFFVPEELWEAFPKGLGLNLSDYLLYQPDYPKSTVIYNPDKYGMPFEEVWISTDDGVKIHAYLIKQQVLDSTSIPCIIFFHGNAGNIGNRLENARVLYRTLRCHILLVEYRGYGLSEGVPTEKGLYKDAKGAFEFVESREDLNSKKIILFGRSLGGAVAIDLASKRAFRNRIAGLIVENTFTSIPDMAKHLIPIRAIRWIPSFCYGNRYDSLQKVGSVKCPSLFIRGVSDDMMPEIMMTKLHKKCSAPLNIYSELEGGHNDTWIGPQYSESISTFVTCAMRAYETGILE